MMRKKSKFLTFVFSCMFGAGQMYIGFMKQGISIMSAAAAIIAIGSLLNSSIIFLILPILWFYSFFDSMNKASLPDELFNRLEDHYLFMPVKESPEFLALIKKYNNYIAAGLIIIGGFVLMDEILDYIAALLTDTDYNQLIFLIDRVRWNGARLLLSVIIITVGIKLIVGKKKELENEESMKQAVDLNSNTQSFTQIAEITMEEKEADERA